MPAPRTLIGLARASHPEPAVAVTAGATALAVIAGRDAPGVAAVAIAVLASQLAVGWHNDWLDADRDAATGRPDKPIPAGAIARRTVGIGAVAAAAVTIPLGLFSGPTAAIAAGVGLVFGLAYNWPLKFTPFSVVPFVVSFGVLPAFVVLGLPGTPAPPWWLIAAGATVGGGAHFANALPDLDDDARTGVRGLPHRLGPAWSTAAAIALLAAASALLVLGPPGRPSPLAVIGMCGAVGVLLAGLLIQLRWPGSRGAFRAMMLAALIDVALLLTAGAFV